MLDHVYALRQGAVLSGKPALIEQITHFQNACRDAARRIGLVPFVAGPEEVFDERRHCVADSKTAAPGAHISETVATGYTFQGQLLRPALVRLSETEPSSAGTLPAEPVASTGEVGA
jgi:molecular chaperone GrpE (heat shock protein)